MLLPEPGGKKRLTAKAGKTTLSVQKPGGGKAGSLWRLPKKLNHARMNDPRETVAGNAEEWIGVPSGGAEGEGKNSQAKGSDQDGTSESAIAKSDPEAHQRGNRRGCGGNLSGLDGGRKTRGVFLSFFAPRHEKYLTGGTSLSPYMIEFGGTT